MTTKPQFLLKDTLLSMVRGSVGSTMFRHAYFQQGTRKADEIRGGNVACAFYVSNMLSMFSLIKRGHTTVTSTERDMKESGWKEIPRPRLGCVLIWEETIFPSGPHRHIGFFVGSNQAVSTNSKRRKVARHHASFHGKRKIERAYWHPRLTKDA
jgi:hypothetical protein